MQRRGHLGGSPPGGMCAACCPSPLSLSRVALHIPNSTSGVNHLCIKSMPAFHLTTPCCPSPPHPHHHHHRAGATCFGTATPTCHWAWARTPAPGPTPHATPPSCWPKTRSTPSTLGWRRTTPGRNKVIFFVTVAPAQLPSAPPALHVLVGTSWPAGPLPPSWQGSPSSGPRCPPGALGSRPWGSPPAALPTRCCTMPPTRPEPGATPPARWRWRE